LASLDKNKLAVLVWHYHDDDLPGPSAAIELTLAHPATAAGKLSVTQYRIDADHSNSYEAWKRLGSPHSLTQEQFTQLEQAGKLAALGAPETAAVENGRAVIRLKLPRQAVALLVCNWELAHD